MEKLRNTLSSWLAVVVGLVCWEVVLNAVIIKKVRYTEIDWKAYMDEVRPVVEEGERNYSLLRGETGPLVYPGGFVGLYAVIREVTGEAVPAAQVLFAVLCISMFLIVAMVYQYAARDDVPALLLCALCLSKRIHSIFVLRLFNDCPAMLILWVSFYFFCKKSHLLGCLFFSMSLSIKMNALLVLPGVLLLLVVHTGPIKSILYILFCVAFQVLVGYPFLLYDSAAYVGASFNFGRVFKRKWSVNYKWVPCEDLPEGQETLLEDCVGLFSSKEFGLAMVGMQLLVLSVFAWRWVRWAGGPLALLLNRATHYTPKQCLLILLTCNFVGICFARSLHFQFYVWYYHSLPILAWYALRPFGIVPALALLLVVEACWNPWKGESSTYESSLLLTCCHGFLLCTLWWNTSNVDEKKKKTE